MKKILILISIFVISSGLLGINSYKNYITIKYLLNLNKYDKAEALIDLFLNKNPEDPFILTEKSFILLNIKKNIKGALSLLEKSLEIYPDYYYSNYLYASILFLEYTKNKKKKNFLDESIKHINISIKDNSKFYNSYFLMGCLLSEKGQYKKSNKYFELANKLKQTPDSFYKMALNYIKINDTKNEIMSYKKILRFSPFDYQALYILSQIYFFNKKDYKNASNYLEKLYLLNPKDKNICSLYLYSLYASKKTKKFLEVSKGIQKIISSIHNKDFQSNILLADIFNQKQDYFYAYQTLKKIDKQKRNYLYYSMLLEILSKLELNQKIAKIYNILKEKKSILSKLSLRDYYNIIYSYIKLNKIEKIPQVISNIKQRLKKEPEVLNDLDNALRTFFQKKQIDVDKIKSKLNIFLVVTLYKNQKKYDIAINILKKVLKKGANQAVLLELCDIYLQQKKYKKTRTILKRMDKKYPSSSVVKNFYAYFLALQNKKLKLAQKLSKYTISKDNENPAYLDTYGFILFRLGRFEESAKFLKRAYEKHPFEPEIIDHLVNYYKLKKNNNSIIKIYKKAINNDVDFKNAIIKKLKNVKENIK